MGSHRRVVVDWQPDAGRFTASGTHAGQHISINAPPALDEVGRSPAGFSATELLLAGAAACSAWDVLEILRKRRASIGGLNVTAEGSQADEPPWEYRRLALHFAIRGEGLSAGVLERVVRLSCVRYCSVLATLRGVASVEASLELVDSAGATSGRLPVRLDVEVAELLDDAADAEPTADEE